MIPYSRQNVTEEDIQAVVNVLRSDYLTQGHVVTQFEQAISAYCEVNYCVATSSATAALHVACLALDVKENDIVWVSALSFVASANCARYCGADVDFVDVEENTGLISVKSLEQKFVNSVALNCLPKVLIVVHIAGQSCNMKAIARLCNIYDVRVIEDASHALGGRYEAEPVGSCRYSDICVFSFHPVKPITSGEGGAITTNDPELEKRSRLFACHGIERDETNFKKLKTGAWYYEQQVLGFNYRLSDIHAALGLSQLKRLDDMVIERRTLAKHYHEALSTLPLVFLSGDDEQSAWHLLIIQVDKRIRSDLFDHLRVAGFWVNLHYMPIPDQPYYSALGNDSAHYAGAKAFSETAISLPLFSGMNLEVVEHIKNTLEQFFET